MEKLIDHNISSKKELEKKKRKKELTKFCAILIFSNLMTLLLFSSSEEVIQEKKFYTTPSGFESIQVKASLFIPFQSFKEAKVLNSLNKVLCKKIVLIKEVSSSETSEDFLNELKQNAFIIEAPTECLASLLTKEKLKIVPTSYLTNKISKRMAYEITY